MPNTDAGAAAIEDIEAFGIRQTERVITEVVAHLSAQIDRAFAQVEVKMAEQDRRLDELAATVRVAAATVTRMVADLGDTVTRPPAEAPAPRPAALDDACSPDPSFTGLRRVELDVCGRHVTQYVQPGQTDPQTVWDDLRDSVTRHTSDEADAWRN